MLGLLGHLTRPDPARELPAHSKLLALEAYWNESCPPGGLPGRGHFNAERMIPWLPHISLIEVGREPLRFRFRLMGTGCVRYAGGDYTGRWIDECVRENDRKKVLTPYVECTERLRPVYSNGVRDAVDSARYSVHKLFLPCTNDGVNANLIVLGVYAMEFSPA